MIETKPLTPALLSDLNLLFCTNRYTEKCWCMWHIIAVKAFHAGASEQNRTRFTHLAESEDTPLGILAYRHSEPVGWCAAGPRERYARAIKTPTYRKVAQETSADVWLVPCFFVRSDARRLGVTKILLTAAVELATTNNVQAIDGFPYTNDKRRSSSQIHVGFASTFASCGFRPIHHPSASRVVMRRVLTP